MFDPQHALSEKARVMTFDPRTTCDQECLITTFQEVYFVSDSFEEAKEKMRSLTQSPSHQVSVIFTVLAGEGGGEIWDEVAVKRLDTLWERNRKSYGFVEKHGIILDTLI